MITGIIKTEENAMYSKEVNWSFHDLERRVEEKEYLLCDVISVGQEKWRVSLHTINLLDSRYINISLSRVTIYGRIPTFSSAYWHAGVLDSDGVWQYDRSGLVNQKALCDEWTTVADWSGPEWTYLVEEKDVYMPDGRFQFVLQFCWDPKCSQKDSEGTTKKLIDADLNITGRAYYSKSAFWIIDDLQRRLEEDKSLLSDTFFFGDQLWRLSLGAVELLDTQYIDVALSRISVYKKLSPFLPFIYWYSGILDRNDTWDYYRKGEIILDETFAEWTIVTDWSGPESTYLCQEKDLYMPHNLLTIAFCLRWTPERKEISKTVGRLETGDDIPQLKEIFWKIDDLKQNIMNYKTLMSDYFQFKGHIWLLSLERVILHNVKYIKISLLRIGSTEGSFCPRYWLKIGILGADKNIRYNSSGWIPSDTESGEETRGVEYSTLVKWNSLTQKKDILISESCLTVSLVLSSFGPLFEYQNRMNKEKTSLSLHPKKVYEYDLVINVKDRLFRTQRNLLQIFSPIMASMVYTRETDGCNEILYLPDCDPEAFEIFLIFANSGELSEMTCEVAENVYYIADKYDVLDLKKNCFRHLSNEIYVDTVCACLDLASRHNLGKLKERAMEFFVKNARNVYHTPSWLRFMVTNTKLANEMIIRSYDNK